ncbi:uncharacterized protein LOC135844061 [Planococcus citri]|uniref:uncharacterized protein LOC135844061 n=1 Tax=Planococcus citri TaxID=170843 RepID=UPI0031F91024
MESRHLQETLPVFHISPRTLQELAASQCALDCWHNVIIMRNIGLDEICSENWLREHLSSFSCTDIAPFPAGVRSLIDHKIRPIGKALHNWFRDHPFLELSPAVVVNCVVLNPAAGDICYKKTAKNLPTANPAFRLKDQFEIACEYCFEEEVERLWLLLENRDFYSSCGFQKSVLAVGAVDYWCSKMRGELLKFYGNYDEKARTPEWWVLSNCRYPRTGIAKWPQVEYFWHQLNPEEQNSLVGIILLLEKFTKHFMLKLDETMLGDLSISQLCRVVEILAEDESCHEYALQVWSYANVKIIIEEDKYSFYKTLYSLSRHLKVKNVSSLLKEIWLSASADFKDYVLCNLEDLFVESFGDLDSRSFGCDVAFFIELLSGVGIRRRQRIWECWWREFFLLAQVSDILKIMTLCFNNADDIVQFKKKYMLDFDKLSDIFTELIEGRVFDELVEHLKFCCSDDEDEKFVREARKKLVLENFGDLEPISCKFLQFVLDSFSSADLVELLNWQFQDREANMLSLCILYDSGELHIFNKALRCFKFPDQRVIELKQFFYERCQYVLMSGDFNSFFVQDWEGFLLWCSSSVENVNRLRDSIAIDDLFENLLINMRKFFLGSRDSFVAKYRYAHVRVFDSIDRLLGWYFRDDEVATAVRQFKYGKVMGYENSEAIKMLLSMVNEEILRRVLLWFFDNEIPELRNFLVAFGIKIFPRNVLWNLTQSFG